MPRLNILLVLCEKQILASADNLCKQFWPGSKTSDTLNVFLKVLELFAADDNKRIKKWPSMFKLFAKAISRAQKVAAGKKREFQIPIE